MLSGGIAIAQFRAMSTDAITATFPAAQKVGRGRKAQAATLEAPAPASDHALAQQSAAGDMAAFEELYARHNRRVYSLCLRMTGNVSEAEDLAQEAFIQLFRKIGSFRGESPSPQACTGSRSTRC